MSGNTSFYIKRFLHEPSGAALSCAELSREILLLYGDPHDQVPLKCVSHVTISPQVQSSRPASTAP